MNAKTQNEKAQDTRDLVEAWARERLLTGGSKPRSIRSDKYRVMRFIHFIEAESLDLAYVDEQTIWNYQGSLLEKKHAHHDKSLGKKTIASIMASLQSFGDFLVARGFWLNNLVKPVKLSTHAASPPVDVPDESTMEAFMTELGKWWEDENLRAQMTSFRFYVIAELQYATGLRAGEVADLEEGDLDLRSLEVTVRQGKGGKDRIVFLTHWAAELLHEFLGLRQLIVRGAETTKRLFGLEQSTMTKSYNAIGLMFGPRGLGSAVGTTISSAMPWATICFAPAALCATSRASWDTRRSAPQRSTPRWTAKMCGRSWTPITPGVPDAPDQQSRAAVVG
jgi:site-specific recombinase XerD